MDTAVVAGFVKEASKKDLIGLGLGAVGAAAGTAGLVQAQRTRTDMKAMRARNTAADALHSAMLYEARTGQRISPDMRAQIGQNYMAANQAYRRRFGSKAPAAAAK